MLVRQMVQMKNKIAMLLMEAGVSYTKQKLHKDSLLVERVERGMTIPAVGAITALTGRWRSGNFCPRGKDLSWKPDYR